MGEKINIMKMHLVFLILILTACSTTVDEKSKNNTFILDTTLNNYKVKLIMSDNKLLKGISNVIHLDIINTNPKNIIIFTKTSEASVNLGENTGDFLIKPTQTTDVVIININIRQIDGQHIEVGKFILKTK